MNWDWKSVEKDGLPDKNFDDTYLVAHRGISSFGYGHPNDDGEWYLDFDASGEEVTHYIKIEPPKEYQEVEG